MTRIAAMLTIAVGLAVATLAGLWMSGGGTASAGDFEDGLKCYRAKAVASESSLSRLIYVQDQFEAKDLIVKKPTEFCTLAGKQGGPVGSSASAPESTPLTCYAIKQAPGQPRFEPVEVVAADQFNEEYFQLTKPYSLCESATKVTDTSTGGFNEFSFEDFTFKCYKIRSLENERFRKIGIELFDQFTAPEGKQARLIRPGLFCSPVEEKKRKAKNDEIWNADFLEPGVEEHVSTISADRDREDPPLSCLNHGYGHSVWYTYMPDNDVTAVIDTEGSTYDTVLGIFQSDMGDSPIGDELACNDDINYPVSGHSEVTVKLSSNIKYYIVVGAFGGDPAGKLKLHMEVDVFTCNDFVCGSGATAATSAASQDSEGESAGRPPNDLMCYTISQRAPEDAFVLAYDQLNSHELQLGRGVFYCTYAEKCYILSKKPFAGDQAGQPPNLFCQDS